MKIIINNRQFRLIKESEIEEKLGVPSDILETGEDLYNDIIGKVRTFDSIEELEKGFELQGNYKVGDHYFTLIKVRFDFDRDENYTPEMFGASTHKISKLTRKFTLSHIEEKDNLTLVFRFLISPTTTVQEIIDLFTETPEKMISTFTHEIGHGYYDVKKGGEKSTERADYQAISSNRFGNIEILNEFVFYSYYIHGIENIVRPSEMAQLLRLHGVTQKEFLNFFQKTEMYEMLKNIQNFSYEELRDELKNKIDEVKKLFDKNDIDYQGMDDEQIIDHVLELLYVNMVNWKQEVMIKILTSNLIESLIGFSGDKQKFYEKYMNNLVKYQDNPLNFFKSETRRFNFVATKMIKKLAKLYDYLTFEKK